MRQKNFFSLFTAITMMFAFLLPGTALAQENADVFGLNDGYRNNTTIEQMEDGSWVITTIGSDPYVASTGLNRDLTEAETTLTFEYQASQEAQLEFFFSRKVGNTYEGGYSYNLGNAPATSEWKRVNLDITKARQEWGWGTIGHTLRVDVGTDGGILFRIRDLRVCTDTPDNPLGQYTVQDGVIQINSQEDFDKWVAGFNTFMTKPVIVNTDVALNTDVTLTSAKGTPIPQVNSVFDGKGHKMTLDITHIEAGVSVEIGCAPIGLLYGTVKNLVVDGTNTSNTKYLASIAKDCHAGSLIENVTSYVNLISEISGDGTHGGINGRNEGSTTFRNVVFAGTISGTVTTQCGGITGWSNARSVYEGVLMIGDIQVDQTGCNTITRNQGNAVIKNVYASAAFNETPGGVVIATPEQLASGEVCYGLNGDQRNIAFYQNLGEDVVPVLDSTHKQVYSDGEYNCDGTLISESASYSNEGTVNIPDHVWNEFGTCDNCGQAQPGFIEQDKDGYLIVDTPEKLIYAANHATNNPTAKIKITADLDMAEVTQYYKPIRGAYAGIFDGGGHTISNLIIDNVPNETSGEADAVVKDQALIGLAGGCTVKNLTLDATCSINGGGYSAGFVGETTGSITITMENLFMHGNVRAAGPNGAGIYGCNMSSTATIVMKNCGVTGNIVGDNEAGALSGWFGGGKATVTNCWFTGTVSGCDNTTSAVICRPAGDTDVTFTNCWSFQGDRKNVGKLDSEDAAKNGELAWKLNGSKFTGVTWYQNLDEEDVCPTLDPTRGVVYKTTEGYATVIESDTESFGKFMKGLQDVGLAYIETEDAQNYANIPMLAEYVELVNAYSTTTDMATITEAYNAEQAKYKEVTASVTAYKNYENTIAEILATLETRDDFSGDDRDFLEGIYLGESAGPGEYEAAPNGTYEYIMENRTLTTKEVNAEIEHVKELLRIAVANGYEPGTEITNMLVNPNFADGFTGWKGALFTGHGASPTEGSTMHAAEIWSANNHDMYQEIVAAKSGIYELQIRGGYRAYNVAASGQLSPYIYMNGNANYLQSVLDGAIPAEEAVDGVNCNLTGGTNDLPILNEEGDTIAWAMHGVISLNKAFEAGRHDNRLVLNVQEGDTIRLGVKHTYFNGGANDWVGIGDIHLTYHGEMAESEEAIDRALESMLARANSLQGIEFKSDADYGKYPNYSKAIQDRLAAAIEKAAGAADVATKYEVIEELSAVFKEAIESKMAYKNFFAEIEKVYDCAYTAFELDESLAGLAAEAENMMATAMEQYETGSLSTEEALECAVAKTIAVQPTIDENGAFHIANTAEYKYFVDTYAKNNPNKDKHHVILEGDVNMNTAMMVTDFYGTFDGQDHTINVNIVREADNAALFENVRGAHVKNLIVRGTIDTKNKYAAGIAAHAHDGSKFDRIQSYVDIIAGISGDGTHAGIVAVNESGDGIFNNCMFAGSMSGDACTCNGGIVGWGSAKVVATGCLVIANITCSQDGANIISRNSVEAKNCYYVTPYGGAPAGATQITEEDLMSGAVAYGLNGGKTRKDVVWRQNLDGSDVIPSLDPTHKIVYIKADGTYTNEIQNEIEKYEGTESDPYIINTANDMALLRRFMLPGRVNYVKLNADIDMSEVTSWTPLNISGDKANGVDYMNLIDFDGQGHVISNFTCTDPTTSYNSFFGILNGNVRNVGFKDAVVACEKTGTGILGGYIGHNNFQNADATKAYSKVENVWVTGQLTGSVDYIGGFFGTVAGPTVVKNCYSNIEIISDAPYVGGIAGRVRDQFHVDQAYAAGSITCANETAKVGGIIGGAQQNATEPGYYNNIVVWNNTDENFGPTVAAKEVTLPTADLLDVVFNADGTATDISPAQQEIQVVGQPKVVYSEKFGQNVFYSESEGNSTTPVSYLKIDYSENQAFKDALTDGYTIETTIAIHNTGLTGTVKPFCATETGGFGFEILSTGQIKHINHTDIDGTAAYRYANTSVYAKMDTYYHLVGIYDKAARKVACYVNGINEATGSAEGVLHFPNAAEHQWIGIGADAGVQSGANFEIINARIYNEPITADMAKALYWKQTGRDFYAGDKVNNISFYNGSNFADLQNVVVNWGSPWKCDMTEGTYPTFDGTLANGINNIESIAKGKIFNINGIQVEKTTKGLYIIDGKKVMVK